MAYNASSSFEDASVSVADSVQLTSSNVSAGVRGLTSDDDFQINMHRFTSPGDAWTRPIIYGSFGMNTNIGEAELQTKNVGRQKSMLDSVSTNHIYLVHHVVITFYGHPSLH